MTGRTPSAPFSQKLKVLGFRAVFWPPINKNLSFWERRNPGLGNSNALELAHRPGEDRERDGDGDGHGEVRVDEPEQRHEI